MHSSWKDILDFLHDKTLEEEAQFLPQDPLIEEDLFLPQEPQEPPFTVPLA